jgi:hypothetical protein
MAELGAVQKAHTLPRLRVLSLAQYATLEALAETFIPAEDCAQGAIDARVADYIDLLLAESDDATKLQWMAGLTELDREARAGFGVPFARLDPAHMRALVAEMTARPDHPESALHAFVQMAQEAAICAYYMPEIRSVEQ